ncbi:MAG: hypothetical protein RLZZ519_124 [Bacteroidota bacterium]|jgi:hypothetical protein
MATITSKDIKEMIRTKVLEHKSHQTIYDELNAAIPNREIDLARMVGGFVTLAQQERFRLWNWLLIVIVGLAAIVNIILALVNTGGIWDVEVTMAFIIAIANGINMFFLWRWNLSAYLTVDILAALSMFEVSSMSVNLVIDPSDLAIWVPFILATYIYSQIGGSYKSQAKQYKDAKGQIRARHTVTFKK